METSAKMFGKGAIITPTNLRDFRLEVAGAAVLPASFSVKDKVGQIKNQNGSSSCVGQAFAYYLEVLNTIETGQKVQLSARDIYSLIYQPKGGSALKDAAAKVCNSGVIPESEASSYLPDGTAPTEAYMRSRSDITPKNEESGMTYIAKSYLTFGSRSVEMYKQAIYQGMGCVAAFNGNNYCWSGAKVSVPDGAHQVEWAHAIYLFGWDDSTKRFLGVNSWSDRWGEKGFFYLPYDYITRGFASNPFVIMDLPNTTYVSWLSILQNLKDKVATLLKLKK